MKSACRLATDLFGNGEETADGEGAIGVGLTPGLGTLAKLGVVSGDELCYYEVTGQFS